MDDSEFSVMDKYRFLLYSGFENRDEVRLKKLSLILWSTSRSEGEILKRRVSGGGIVPLLTGNYD